MEEGGSLAESSGHGASGPFQGAPAAIREVFGRGHYHTYLPPNQLIFSVRSWGTCI